MGLPQTAGTQSFGSLLREAMDREGMSIRVLAQALEISPTTVQSWRDDRSSPDVAQLRQMAVLLKTSIAALAGEATRSSQASAPAPDIGGAEVVLKRLTNRRFKKLARDAAATTPDLLVAIEAAEAYLRLKKP